MGNVANNGSGWIRQDKRLAIYLRDGGECVYCTASISDEGITMSLDHVTPQSCGGDNSESNLVTCCTRCNSTRGNRDVAKFAHDVANYRHDSPEKVEADAASILDYIATQTVTDLAPFRAEAKAIKNRARTQTDAYRAAFG